eukprot:gnl/MRDRNA2_/MRDRNA2_56625_c0_seq1.p1 gnl/MRDRNA2_/MRDRNA2_56625_c0~~gnl/MRDRNA2_/MRDRNA2_56625_c0_seq1.p1  ORF type:complete len:458 (-),score=73.09 gnl/MRDRNA2_/MRDRNA2_56625_c0_seq1:405-1778(-)
MFSTMKNAIFPSPESKPWLYASPASTMPPNSPPGPRWSLGSTASDFSENPRDLEGDYQKMLDDARSPAPEPPLKASKVDYKKHALEIVLPVCVGAICLVAVFLVRMSWLESHAAAQPKIWDPNLPREYNTEPLAKSVIRKFDAYNMARGGRDDAKTFNANVNRYMRPDMLYESVGFGTWRTPAGWSAGEEMHYGMAFPETIFTQMLFFGDEEVATTTTYGKALWSGDLFGVKAPNKFVTLRITDFYYIEPDAPGHGRISYNFMMIDWADALRQIGRRMLPQPALPEGLVLPPTANDGVPAPLSILVQAEERDAKAARAVAEAALVQDWTGTGTSVLNWHEDLTYYGPAGIGCARNLTDYSEHVVGPFRKAFTNRQAIVELSACEGNYCALFGRLSGRGVGKWLGLPTPGRDVSMRFAMHYRIVGNKVQEGWSIFDFPGLFAELGLDFYALAAAGGRF